MMPTARVENWLDRLTALRHDRPGPLAVLSFLRGKASRMGA